jgi:hypothetical protein
MPSTIPLTIFGLAVANLQPASGFAEECGQGIDRAPDGGWIRCHQGLFAYQGQLLADPVELGIEHVDAPARFILDGDPFLGDARLVLERFAQLLVHVGVGELLLQFGEMLGGPAVTGSEHRFRGGSRDHQAHMQFGEAPDAFNVLIARLRRFQNALQLAALLLELLLALLALIIEPRAHKLSVVGLRRQVHGIDRAPEAAVGGDDAGQRQDNTGSDQIERWVDEVADEPDRRDREPDGRNRHAGGARIEGSPQIPKHRTFPQ